MVSFIISDSGQRRSSGKRLICRRLVEGTGHYIVGLVNTFKLEAELCRPFSLCRRIEK